MRCRLRQRGRADPCPGSHARRRGGPLLRESPCGVRAPPGRPSRRGPCAAAPVVARAADFGAGFGGGWVMDSGFMLSRTLSELALSPASRHYLQTSMYLARRSLRNTNEGRRTFGFVAVGVFGTSRSLSGSIEVDWWDGSGRVMPGFPSRSVRATGMCDRPTTERMPSSPPESPSVGSSTVSRALDGWTSALPWRPEVREAC